MSHPYHVIRVRVTSLCFWSTPRSANYITSCYAKCQNAVDKDRVGIILKGKIIRATNDNTLWIKDWSKEPLPLLESEMATATVLPVFKPEPKKRLSTALTSRLGLRLRSRSRSSSRSRSRSPQKPRQRSPPRGRRRRDRGGSSDSENDWTPPPTAKKGKGRNLDHSFSKRGGKGKNKGKDLFQYCQNFCQRQDFNTFDNYACSISGDLAGGLMFMCVSCLISCGCFLLMIEVLPHSLQLDTKPVGTMFETKLTTRNIRTSGAFVIFNVFTT
ncbi:Leukocyte receptor cluster (LRC) member 8 [Homalodisca vitripennis]|nr:Leukocyte receptor cluster (LRC) member 8 [Homalodisca vitripennis]